MGHCKIPDTSRYEEYKFQGICTGICSCKQPKERGEKATLQRKSIEGKKTNEIEKRNGVQSCQMLNRAGVSSAFFQLEHIGRWDFCMPLGPKKCHPKQWLCQEKKLVSIDSHPQEGVEEMLKCKSEEFRLKCKPYGSRIAKVPSIIIHQVMWFLQSIKTRPQKLRGVPTHQEHSLLHWPPYCLCKLMGGSIDLLEFCRLSAAFFWRGNLLALSLTLRLSTKNSRRKHTLNRLGRIAALDRPTSSQPRTIHAMTTTSRKWKVKAPWYDRGVDKWPERT